MPLTSDRAEHRLRSRPRDRGTPSPPTSHHRPVITAFCACAWYDDLTPPCPSRQDPLRLELLHPQPTTQNSIQNLVALPSSPHRSPPPRVRGLRDAPRGLRPRSARAHSAPSPSFLGPGVGRSRSPLPALCTRLAGPCAGLSRALLFPACGQAHTASPSAGARPVPVPACVDFSPPGPPLGGALHEIPASIAPPAPPRGGVATPSPT